ncbi:MAG: arylamine N-acetyltransferase [bacterium]
MRLYNWEVAGRLEYVILDWRAHWGELIVDGEKSNLLKLFESHFGLKEDAELGLAHLEKSVSCFARIPYENLTKIIRAFEQEDIQKKLRRPEDVLKDFIRWGTGGTCFSLTFCLKSILSEYGYDCRYRMADLGQRQSNHCALTVYLHQRLWLIDPGYLIVKPLPMPETGSVVHETSLHPVLLEKDVISGGSHLSTMDPNGVKYRYYLHGEDCAEDNFFTHWKDSFSWNMMNSLLITRIIPKGRIYLHDRHFRRFDRTSHRCEKLKDGFDDSVAAYTGINKEIVVRAREILAENKRSLRENRRQDGKSGSTRAC